jgi:vacuolar-type H+-ATPase subunit F/Vma7
MSASTSSEHAARASTDAARVIVMASPPVAVGFRLLGVELTGDATVEALERLLEELVSHHQSALVFVETTLTRSNGRWLTYVREVSNNILLVELPPLRNVREQPSKDALGRTSTEWQD